MAEMKTLYTEIMIEVERAIQIYGLEYKCLDDPKDRQEVVEAVTLHMGEVLLRRLTERTGR